MAKIFSLGICCHRNYLEGSGAGRHVQEEGAQGRDQRTRVLLKKQTHQNKKVHEVECSLHSSLLKPGLFLVGPCPSPN